MTSLSEEELTRLLFQEDRPKGLRGRRGHYGQRVEMRCRVEPWMMDALEETALVHDRTLQQEMSVAIREWCQRNRSAVLFARRQEVEWRNEEVLRNEIEQRMREQGDGRDQEADQAE